MVTFKLMDTKKRKQKASLILRVASLALLMQIQPLFTMDQTKKSGQLSKSSEASRANLNIRNTPSKKITSFEKISEKAKSLLETRGMTRLEQLQKLLEYMETTDTEKADEYRKIVTAVENAKVFSTITQALAKKLLVISGQLGGDKYHTIQQLNEAMDKIILQQVTKTADILQTFSQEAQRLYEIKGASRLNQLQKLLGSKAFAALEEIAANDAKEYTEIINAITSAEVDDTIREALAKKLLEISGQLGEKKTIESVIKEMNKFIYRVEEKAKEKSKDPEERKSLAPKTRLRKADMEKYPKSQEHNFPTIQQDSEYQSKQELFYSSLSRIYVVIQNGDNAIALNLARSLREQKWHPLIVNKFVGQLNDIINLLDEKVKKEGPTTKSLIVLPPPITEPLSPPPTHQEPIIPLLPPQKTFIKPISQEVINHRFQEIKSLLQEKVRKEGPTTTSTRPLPKTPSNPIPQKSVQKKQSENEKQPVKKPERIDLGGSDFLAQVKAQKEKLKRESEQKPLGKSPLEESPLEESKEETGLLGGLKGAFNRSKPIIQKKGESSESEEDKQEWENQKSEEEGKEKVVKKQPSKISVHADEKEIKILTDKEEIEKLEGEAQEIKNNISKIEEKLKDKSVTYDRDMILKDNRQLSGLEKALKNIQEKINEKKRPKQEGGMPKIEAGSMAEYAAKLQALKKAAEEDKSEWSSSEESSGK